MELTYSISYSVTNQIPLYPASWIAAIATPSSPHTMKASLPSVEDSSAQMEWEAGCTHTHTTQLKLIAPYKGPRADSEEIQDRKMGHFMCRSKRKLSAPD